MDDVDRRILSRIQKNFPLVERPFKTLADELGLTEKEMMDRIRRLKGDGIIYRLGASLDSRKIGLVSSLCAARVPEERIEDFVREVNRHPGVTHNYRRNHEYNVWFTMTARNYEEIESFLQRVSERTGVRDILNLPSLKIFKINVEFSF